MSWFETVGLSVLIQVSQSRLGCEDLVVYHVPELLREDVHVAGCVIAADEMSMSTLGGGDLVNEARHFAVKSHALLEHGVVDRVE